MLSEPEGNEAVVQIATPAELTGIAAGHSGIGDPLSVKVTVPLRGIGPLEGVTVAVKVTEAVTTEVKVSGAVPGVEEDASVVVLLASRTCWVKVPLLAMNFGSLI
jgi:hypothetical protein